MKEVSPESFAALLTLAEHVYGTARSKGCTRPASRTVDDYEDQPRYRTWHAWSVWEWHYNRSVLASGRTMDTRWPSDSELQPASLAEGEQERNSRVEDYVITFTDSKETWEVHPKTERDFKAFPPGTRCRIRVGVANGVTVVPGYTILPSSDPVKGY